jgi:hypothetical protein
LIVNDRRVRYGDLFLFGDERFPRPAQPPKTQRLEATPPTVVHGYYWAGAKPVLPVDSGDIIDVDTC